MRRVIKIGSRVAFKREFLQSTGQYLGWAPFARGTVTDLTSLVKGQYLALVHWDDGTVTTTSVTSLLHENDISLESP